MATQSPSTISYVNTYKHRSTTTNSYKGTDCNDDESFSWIDSKFPKKIDDTCITNTHGLTIPILYVCGWNFLTKIHFGRLHHITPYIQRRGCKRCYFRNEGRALLHGRYRLPKWKRNGFKQPRRLILVANNIVSCIADFATKTLENKKVLRRRYKK